MMIIDQIEPMLHALDAALTTKAETMGCADNPTLARHLMALEDRLSKLEEPGS